MATRSSFLSTRSTIVSARHRDSHAMTHAAIWERVRLAAGCAATLVALATFGPLPLSAQTAAGNIPLQPAPEIAGVIKGGTRPQVIATGLNGADDPIWVPGVGLVFSEVNADRIVRVSDADAL